nr:replication factor A protein 1-like [Ipomoea batatas]
MESIHVKFIQMLYLVGTNYSEPDSLQYIFHDEEGTFISMHIPNECVRKELDGANFPTFTYPLSEPQSKSMTSTNEKTLQDLSNALMHVVSIKDIYEKGKAGEFWIGGQIVAIENSYNWFVLCCQANDCNSQLIPLPSGEYECKKCLTNWTKGIDKYNLKLQVEDANGNAKLKLVDKDCIQLIGKTASDLRAKHRRITPQLPKEIQSLVGLGMLFMVDVKREQLENRYAPFSVTKIINDQTLVSLYCPEVLKKNWYLEPEEGDINLLDEVDY